MYPIRSWLYVGKYRETLDYVVLHQSEIGAMLQLAESIQQPEISSLYVPVEDGESLPLDRLRTGVEFVRTEKAKDKKVLIACGAGISRAASFAIASLKEEENRSLLDAFQQIQAEHPQASPHMALWQSLCEYYAEDVPYKRILKLILQAKTTAKQRLIIP
jgi:protein-tyrosine phosphatase